MISTKKPVDLLLFGAFVYRLIYNFVIKQYIRSVKDPDQHTIENHTINGVKIKLMMIRGYPEIHFYNVR